MFTTHLHAWLQHHSPTSPDTHIPIPENCNKYRKILNACLRNLNTTFTVEQRKCYTPLLCTLNVMMSDILGNERCGYIKMARNDTN